MILGRWRGGNGRICRGIPGFSDGARVRRGDSVHGGYGWGGWAKKFLKIFKKRGENPENWGARGTGRRCRGTLYRVCGAIVRRDLHVWRPGL